MAEYKAKLEKLSNKNYMLWKFKMELLLKKEDVWKAITKEKPIRVMSSNGIVENEKEINSWVRANEQAFSIIGLSIDDDQIMRIRNEETALGAWNKLKTFHEKATLSNKVHLMRTICSLKMGANENVTEHINKMQDLFLQLRAISSDELADAWRVAMLLSSLPKGYDTWVTALEARDEKDLTFGFVHTNNFIEGDQKLLNAVHEKRELVCFFCKKKNHMKKDCQDFKRWKAKQQNHNDKVKILQQHDHLFVIGEKKNIWLLDSGATRHVTNDKNFFDEIDISYKGHIEVGNGQKVPVNGIGCGKIHLVNANGSKSVVKATEVLYAPSLNVKVLSVGKIIERGYDLNFKQEYCQIFKNGNELGIADRKNNLYELRTVDKVNTTISCHNDKCIHAWHRLLGHRDIESIRKMARNGLVYGMEIVECGIKEKCEICVKAKLARQSFPKASSRKSKAPLELIHTDVIGPMPTQTPSGKRYIVTLTDDFSRYSICHLLSNKSEVDQVIVNFVEMTKTQFNRKPKIIRSDRGGEYTSKNLITFLKSHGIQSQLTAAYSPEQNGVAERKNRTIMEMVRCLLLNANLPNSFWGEAVATAVYILNRTVTRATESIPYEMWFGKKVSVKYMQIFGSKCYVHIPSEKRRKLDAVAKKMIFLGYDQESKAYRCYDSITKRVIISRDVKFFSLGNDQELSIKGKTYKNEISYKFKSSDTVQEEKDLQDTTRQEDNDVNEEYIDNLDDATVQEDNDANEEYADSLDETIVQEETDSYKELDE